MPRRDYSGNAVPTTITSGITDTSLTISIADATGWPTGGGNGKFFVTLNRGLSNEERVLVESRTSTTLTIASVGDRGVDETAASTHALGSTIHHTLSAVDVDEANQHKNDTALDDHTQYMKADGTRHDDTARHTFGGAFATPATPPQISTTGSAGAAAGPARSDHTHSLGAGSINASSLFTAGVVNANQLGTGAVTEAKIGTGAVTEAKIGTDAVVTAKIQDGAVTAPKFVSTLARRYIVADAAALAALTGLREGDTAYQVDNDYEHYYNGTIWIGPIRARVHHNATQAISTSTVTALAFNSERYDIGATHSTSVNNNRLTVPTGMGGLYAMGGHVDWQQNSAGWRTMGIRVNGTTVVAFTADVPGAPNMPVTQTVSTEYELAAGDYIELRVEQNSGGNLNILTANSYTPEFWFRRIGPVA